MRDEYELRGETESLTTEIEIPVMEDIRAICEYSKHSMPEIVNMALKRFIAGHKDFFPPGHQSTWQTKHGRK